jgi:F-type H+-transporting ATPase subunit a
MLKDGIHYEHPIFAEPVAEIFGFVVTNTLLTSYIVTIFLVILALVFNRKIKQNPGRLQNGFEMVIETFLGIFDSLTGSRERSLKFFPLVFAFFIFILFNNLVGILPGVGSIGQIISSGGEKYFIPYIKNATADLNATLAFALIGVVASHIIGVLTIGVWKYINKFINLEALIEIPRKVRKDPRVLMINPIKIFTGFIEIIGEIAKVASLSFRLFGNIFAGKILLAFMIGIFAFGLPLPFMFMEILVGFMQAFVFSLLVLAYLVTMTTAEGH